ncbi:MAG: S-ribosylhomocysteine lyase [Oscillospiraceae bacterium]|jgi:S-ribosylhomocysteine lyase|nr:S-ribosylhomocysteine lyase [Oscillospiraceae bacterium]
MEKIASFTINHDILTEGIYISRIDGDITTYDIRMVRPNTPPFMEVAAMHTIEHIAATYLRNSEHKNSIIYFGPMGCRTGFYLLTRELPSDIVMELIVRAFSSIAGWEGDIPGTTSIECGNYLEHDLPTAKEYAEKFLLTAKNLTVQSLKYPE